MRIVISVLAILFGMLHMVAAVTQFKSKDPAVRGLAIAMACGGIMLICAAVGHLAAGNLKASDAMFAAAGCLLICGAAYSNGKRSGNFHPVHHMIRGVIVVLLIVGVLVW